MTRWKKLGIVAGGGLLPARIAASCRERREPFHLIRITGYADEAVATLPGDDCAIGELGKSLRIFKEHGCDAIVFAGVVRRPNFSSVKVDWRGAALLPKLIAAAARGDGAILQTMVDAFEAEGFLVVGADEAVQGLAASEGAIGAHRPDAEDFTDIRKAAEVIKALGPFDIGQAAVVAKGLVLAVEAAEGTDEMLARCTRMPEGVRGGGKAGVLVKRPKPGQELRVDLPVIGVETVRQAKAAGLKGVAVEAEVALIIDRDEVIRAADDAGLFIYGFTDAELHKA